MFGGEPALAALAWRLDAPLLSASTAAVGGGIGLREWVVNVQVPSEYGRRDVSAHIAEVAAALGLVGAGVGMLTAAEVGAVATAEDAGVRVEATVGLTRPVWAAAPATECETAVAPGTVNMVVFLPVRHSDAALANLLCTVTEAKVQALLEAGVAGTGTASDAVTVLCAVSGSTEPFGGPRSAYGAPVARAVHAALGVGDDGAMITMVLGGTRSGKSAFAEQLASSHDAPVTYVATMILAGDPELEARVAAHRRRRDPAWGTVEAGDDLPHVLAGLRGTVLVDSLGPWVAAAADTDGRGGMAADDTGLCAALLGRSGDTVVVSDEVGMAVHPSTEEGRRFQDALGSVNHAVSAVADHVYLVVAGRALGAPALPSAPMRRALSFLTVLGRAAEPNERTLSWFPLVGIGVGALVGAAWWVAGRVWPAAVAAVVAVVVDAAVTGGLHLDGLADAADGLLPAVDRTRRLEIMADPRVGAFGALALVLVLSLRATALAVTVARPLVVVGLWCGSRTMMAVVARTLPYAHTDGGTASSFVGEDHSRAARYGVAVYGMGLAFAVAALGAGDRGLVVVGAEVMAMVAVVWFAFRRIGGYTGDVLGAMGVLGETVGLLALAAR